MRGKVDRSTKLAVATGLALVVGAFLFIMTGSAILYFSSYFAGSPGTGLGSSLVAAGYVILAILVIILVVVIAYLLSRSRGSYDGGWSP